MCGSIVSFACETAKAVVMSYGFRFGFRNPQNYKRVITPIKGEKGKVRMPTNPHILKNWG